MRKIALLGALAGSLLGCDESSTRPDPDPPGETEVDIDGFRIMQSSTVVFEWSETDPAEADTLQMTWREPLGVRFVWTGPAGDSVAPPVNAQFVVTTANEDYATWQPASAPPFWGTFQTGGYPEVETSFRVVLASGSAQLVNTPQLILHVSP